MNNNTLSNEQKLRIEENKKRALAKRQERVHGQSPQKTATLNPNASAFVPKATNQSYTKSAHPQATPSSSYNAPGNQNYNRSTASTLGAAPKGLHGIGPPNKTWTNKGQTSYTSKAGSVIKKNQFYGSAAQPALKGQCVLIARDRFEVTIGFSQPVVEVFKTISSKVYDATKRKWTFNIRDHDTLIKAVSGLRPAIQVEPLPKAIVQVFGRKAGADRPIIPQADLVQVDDILASSLMPFQREGVNFGVHLNGRVLIADDMGLGKTLQAICLACVYRNKWPVLIVTPSSVRFDWAQQFKRWVPSLDHSRIKVAVTGRDDATSGLVNIISYDLLSRKVKDLTEARFRIIIMDESHFLKNSKTVRTKAALPLLQSAQHVILLSGTPALSRPSELYTQIVAVCPRMFKFHEFGVRYCDGKEQPWGWDFSGASNMQELQLLLEEKVMIRRLKTEVLSQLPAKRRQMVILDPVLVAKSRNLIQASKVMEKKLSGMQKRGALLQYFHETCKVKVSAVRDYVKDMVAAEKKFIIFAHHKEMLDSIEDAVASEDVQYIRIDGSTTSEQRNFFCRTFQSKEECKVAVLSITAANAGLNMAAASIVVFAELFWNPGILVQAEDRVHRLGQQDSVLVYYLVAQNTADDYIWPLVQSKLQVLGKAGLAGDDFEDTDATHVRDPEEKKMLDMFEESFIEESPVQDTEGTPTKQKTSPRKRKATDSPSSSPMKAKTTGSPYKRNKLSPGKGQTGINQFFQVKDIRTSRSPHKTDATHTESYAEKPLFQMPGTETSVTEDRDPQRAFDASVSSGADRACGAALSEWDIEMAEKDLAEVADLDWDDDF
ncbi:SWI/SNF-related matrix-associated actin-dependent regulator of chromatin subfamily A-like protein 1 [Littorina saxatilis]|uniref:SWI/SNF-related matrix-associated actin-dependent regulator of chromatin subfamily A-like protein 1 n=1 Tax=Littorina saxatilis TaxID=31220 RepID=UPI0038B54A24